MTIQYWKSNRSIWMNVTRKHRSMTNSRPDQASGGQRERLVHREFIRWTHQITQTNSNQRALHHGYSKNRFIHIRDPSDTHATKSGRISDRLEQANQYLEMTLLVQYLDAPIWRDFSSLVSKLDHRCQPTSDRHLREWTWLIDLKSERSQCSSFSEQWIVFFDIEIDH